MGMRVGRGSSDEIESKQQSCIECSALYIDVSYMIFNNTVIMAKTRKFMVNMIFEPNEHQKDGMYIYLLPTTKQ